MIIAVGDLLGSQRLSKAMKAHKLAACSALSILRDNVTTNIILILYAYHFYIYNKDIHHLVFKRRARLSCSIHHIYSASKHTSARGVLDIAIFILDTGYADKKRGPNDNPIYCK